MFANYSRFLSYELFGNLWDNINHLVPGAPLKGYRYLNKAVTESYRFTQLYVTFQWTPGTKGLIQSTETRFIVKM